MEAVLLMGVQGAGKSTFYLRHFFRSHVRINLDMLRTRQRELRLIRACLETTTRLAIDNTNPSRFDRARYLPLAKASRFETVGYWLDVPVEQCLARNAARPASERVPEVAIYATHANFEPPEWDEGFDRLFHVQFDEQGQYRINAWQPPPP